jgi:O-antigen ligase
MVPTSVSYALITLTYSVAVFVLLRGQYELKFQYRTYVPALLLLICTTIVSSVANQSIDNAIRLVAFSFFTVINLLIIPQLVSFKDFLVVVSRLSAISVLLGLLPYLGLPSDVVLADLSPWGVNVYWHPDIIVITSIFSNPNTLGFFTLAGAVSALGEWQYSRSRVAIVYLVISGVGLALTNNRSGWLGLLVAFLVLFAFVIGGEDFVVISLIGGIFLTLGLLAVVFGVLPGPSIISELSFNGRREIWIEASRRFREAPLFGHGLQYGGTHNSYVRMFTSLGILGGILYLFISIGTTVQSAQRIRLKPELIITMFLTAFMIIQMFEGISFIGVSIHSTIISIVTGYFICGLRADDLFVQHASEGRSTPSRIVDDQLN